MGALSVCQIKSIAQQLLKSLNDINELNIFLGCLSPENIIITEDVDKVTGKKYLTAQISKAMVMHIFMDSESVRK